MTRPAPDRISDERLAARIADYEARSAGQTRFVGQEPTSLDELLMICRELQELRAERAERAWRPIADNDIGDRDVMLYVPGWPGSVTIGLWYPGATHWRPLPEPPRPLPEEPAP